MRFKKRDEIGRMFEEYMFDIQGTPAWVMEGKSLTGLALVKKYVLKLLYDVETVRNGRVILDHSIALVETRI